MEWLPPASAPIGIQRREHPVFDILIQNGQVIDGSGAPGYRADVAVQGNRIAGIGELDSDRAEKVIDAAGCVVTPGLVDMHSHTDFALPLCPTADSLAHQGITTAVIGQCGASPAPLFAETRDEVVTSMESEELPLPWDEWSGFGSYLDYLKRIGISINVVPLVGQGMVRAGVVGFSAEPADETQMARMQDEVVRAMEEGAIGVSTGLIYPPGSFASTEELIAFTRPAGERDGYYFTHIRGEEKTLLEAVAEAIRIGRETGAAVQISHFKASGRENWAKSAPALALIREARAEGLDVTADMYPYLASSTNLSALLPEWAHQGGKPALLARLADADGEARQRMAAEIRSAHPFRLIDWSAVLIASSPRNRALQGRRVDELAAEAGKSPEEWVFDALVETEEQIDMIGFGMSEENRKTELRHPAMMIGTDGYGLPIDGPLAKGHPHPRSYGTFPRILGCYVREQGVITLEEAIWKMSGLPALKLRWTDRGLVREGYQADLVILNPDTVIDRATFQAPHQYPAGIHHVIVNGRLVIHDGVHTRALPGRVLSRPSR
jgi:N-acyl-D-amino-acid deacylase